VPSQIRNPAAHFGNSLKIKASRPRATTAKYAVLTSWPVGCLWASPAPGAVWCSA